jgi:hypothetical protein
MSNQQQMDAKTKEMKSLIYKPEKGPAIQNYTA